MRMFSAIAPTSAVALWLFVTSAAAAPSAPARPPSSTPLGTRPTLDEVRRGTVRPSHGATRGRFDSTGYALTADQMAKVWERSSAPPAPDTFGVALEGPGAFGASAGTGARFARSSCL
jgi:hypothetical protein